MSCCTSCCGQNPLAMSTTNPNPSICENPCCCTGDGGAGGLSANLNSILKWGSVITAQVQGRPVAVNKCGVRIGAKGSTSLSNFSGSSMLLILLIVGGLIFLATRN